MNGRIEINPKILFGKPVIRGTRIPVEIVVRKLSEGISVVQILADYPRLTEDNVRAALGFAAESLGRDEILPLSD